MPLPDDALLIRPWAASGDTVTPESQGLTRANGWPASYSQAGGDTPEREVFNQLFGELSAFAAYLRDHGALAEWHAQVVYVHPATVVGSNGSIYRSVQGSTNVNPVTDSDNSHWQPFTVDIADGSITLAKLASFILETSYIPNLPASRITSGVFNRARIPWPGVQALTDAATIAWNVTNGVVGTVTLGGNRTLAVPTGGANGVSALLRVKQGTGGSKTLTLHSDIKRGDVDAPTLSTAAGTTDLLAFHRAGSTWCYAGLVAGYTGL